MQLQIQSTSDEVVCDLYALSRGPDIRISSYTGCIINSVQFNSKDRDDRCTTQNSGVCVFGGHDSEVIELKYVDRKQVILFRCDWYDTNPKNNRIHEDHYFISIDTRYFWYKNEPFILASQAQ